MRGFFFCAKSAVTLLFGMWTLQLIMSFIVLFVILLMWWWRTMPQLSFTIFNHKVMLSLCVRKVRWAYGVTSRLSSLTEQTKGEQSMHMLLYDIDYPLDCDRSTFRGDVYRWFRENLNRDFAMFDTPNGLHVYCDKCQEWRLTIFEMVKCPYLDETFFQIGLRRGYWCLEQKSKDEAIYQANAPNEYMKIRRFVKNGEDM